MCVNSLLGREIVADWWTQIVLVAIGVHVALLVCQSQINIVGVGYLDVGAPQQLYHCFGQAFDMCWHDRHVDGLGSHYYSLKKKIVGRVFQKWASNIND